MHCTLLSFHLLGFLTGTLQNHARKYSQPIDQLSFNFNIIPKYRSQDEVATEMTTLGYGEILSMDLELDTPEDGVLIHGLFLEAACWNMEDMVLADATVGEMTSVSLKLLPKVNCSHYITQGDYDF